MWNVDRFGYQPDHPILEVLVDVGAIADGGWWSYTTQDPAADYYVVAFTTGDGTSRGPTPDFIWSDVPREFGYER